MADQKKYRLREGFTHYQVTDAGVTRMSAGDVLELTDAQAASFADRFESDEAPAKRIAPEADVPPPADAPPAKNQQPKDAK